MSGQVSMRLCFVPYTASRRLESAEVARMCPNLQCDLFAEEQGMLGVCLAEDMSMACPKSGLPEGVLLTADTREAE